MTGLKKGSSTSMIDLGKYEFKDFNTEEITPEESFMNAYTQEIDELEQVHSSTELLFTIEMTNRKSQNKIK